MTLLIWGIRAGFRDYVDALPDAAVELDGVARVDAGFAFPHSVDARFHGALRITAHAGALDVTLAEPAIEDHTDVGVVLTAHIGARRIPVVRLRDALSASALATGGVATEAVLTHEGAAWLGGVYNPWARMDPVIVSD